MKEDHQLTEWVLNTKAGDRSAFKHLFDHFQEAIFNFLVYKTGDADLSEDILQDTFLKLWRNREELDEGLSIKSYLFTMANNAALNHFRHQKVVYAHQANYKFDGQSDSPERIAESNEFYDQLLGTIENLPEKTRIAFMMSRFENLTYQEIADRTGVSIKTIETQIGKALRVIRDKLKEINQ